jgi:hypothetical protein
MTLKWVMMTLPGSKPGFPIRGTYGHNVYNRTGLSGSGTFAQGFGAIPEEYKPALLWTYNHTFRNSDEKEGAPFDTINHYPHRAVLSFINWPLGTAERNPGDLLPRVILDKHFSFVVFRNRWQDENDILITALFRGSKGNYSVPGGEILVWGLGQHSAFPTKVSGDITSVQPGEKNVTVRTSAGSLGVDFSGASGAEALIVFSGSVSGGKSGKAPTIQAGKNTFTVQILGKNPPEAKVEGDALVVGGQTVTYDGETIRFSK